MSKPSSQARHVALRLAGLGLVCGGMNDYKGRTIRIHPSTLASMGRDGLLERSDILDPNTGASNWWRITSLGQHEALRLGPVTLPSCSF